MPIITALEPRRGRVVNVFLDGSLAFSLGQELARDAGLEVGQELHPSQVQELLHQDLLRHARDHALRLLSYRPRSEREVRERLRRHPFPPEVVAQVAAQLRERGLVDDRTFSRFWRESRERFSPRSRRVIEGELRQKGVDPALAKEAASTLDEEALCLQAARKKLPTLEALPPESRRKKLISFLRRRGFSWEVISRAVKALDSLRG